LTTLLCETNTNDHHDVEEELGSQSDFTEVVDDTQTPQTPMINLSDPALWPKICDRKIIRSPNSSWPNESSAYE
jgi:hypothetical protein